MDDLGIAALLTQLAGTVAYPCSSQLTEALGRFQQGDIRAAHNLVVDVSWNYWVNGKTEPADLTTVKWALYERRMGVYGAIGEPTNYRIVTDGRLLQG